MKILIILATLALLVVGCAGTHQPVLDAASSGDINAIKSLRAAGKNLNESDKYGITPLMSALSNKEFETAKYLIESGADLKAKETNGFDALILAVDNEQPETINFLLDNGADIEARDTQSRTPLIHAICYKKNIEIIKLLIDKGADIEGRDATGKTPLALAAWEANSIDIVKLLIENGADVNAKDNQSDTVLSLALTVNKRLDFAIELLRSGAKLFDIDEAKARLFFIGDGYFYKVGADISIEDHYRYLENGTELAFVDISPGNHIISIPVSWHQTKVDADINVTAGQSYYFKISQNTSHKVANVVGTIASPLVGGVIFETVAEKTTGKGPFSITPIEEPIAKEKIHALLSAF